MSIILPKLIKKRVLKRTVIDFSNKNMDLQVLKQCELKEVAKYYHLQISGNKQKLVTRISTLFIQDIKVIILQKNIRGFFVRFSFKLRGDGFKNRKLCLNGSDFYTLEPLANIPFYRFYSYTDDKKFTYGFDIESLIVLYSKVGVIDNPYNRMKLDSNTLSKIFSLYGMVKILFSKHLELNFPTPRIQKNFTYRNVRSEIREIISVPYMNNVQNILSLIPEEFHSQSNINNLHARLEASNRYLIEIRNQPINRRIEEIFIAIDRLGQYTNSYWFSSLRQFEFTRLYYNLKDIWIWKANLTDDIRHQICPFGDPFANTVINDNDYLEACIIVIENIIYSAPDIEMQKIGVLHVISALTSVSNEARIQYDWLYDISQMWSN
jgi:hypothetical protein